MTRTGRFHVPNVCTRGYGPEKERRVKEESETDPVETLPISYTSDIRKQKIDHRVVKTEKYQFTIFERT